MVRITTRRANHAEPAVKRLPLPQKRPEVGKTGITRPDTTQHRLFRSRSDPTAPETGTYADPALSIKGSPIKDLDLSGR